jgi:Protein of unknown function (DUF3040)
VKALNDEAAGREIPVPLTHEEREQLEQLERGLSREDPAFAAKMRAGLAGDPFMTSPWNVVMLLVGILILLVGIEMQFMLIGVIGCLFMGVGAYRMRNRPKSSKSLRHFRQHSE